MGNNVVSVIVACYNDGRYLAETVESVMQQSYPYWECIIINDGSTDNSEPVALELIEKDTRISYYKINNSGVCFARNYGAEKSNGSLILPLDADDKIHKTYIEKAVKVLANTEIKIAYCEAEFFDKKTGRFDLPEYSLSELSKNNMMFCSAVFRKQDFLSAGGYNLNMKHGWEDWDLWISILKNGGSVYKIPEVLFYYRIKEQSRTTTLESSHRQIMFMQMYLNHTDFFNEHYAEPFEIFREYKRLKDVNEDLRKQMSYLRGIIKLKPSSYIQLAKNLRKKVLK